MNFMRCRIKFIKKSSCAPRGLFFSVLALHHSELEFMMYKILYVYCINMNLCSNLTLTASHYMNSLASIALFEENPSETSEVINRNTTSLFAVTRRQSMLHLFPFAFTKLSYLFSKQFEFQQHLFFSTIFICFLIIFVNISTISKWFQQ